MKYRADFWERLFVAVFLISCWLWLFLAVPYQMGFKEQLGVFVLKPAFLSAYLGKPAVLACIAGDFLTQFFCFRPIGPSITVLLFLLIWAAASRILERLGVGGSRLLLALLPVAAEMSFIVSLNYPLSSSAGLAISLLMGAFCLRPGSVTARTVRFCVALPLAYVLAGAHVITLLLVFVLWNWRRIAATSVVTVAAAAFVLLAGRWYNLSLSGSLVYPVILGYRLPPTGLLALGPVSVAVAILLGKAGIKPWLSTLLASLSLFGALYFTYSQAVEFEVGINTNAYRKDWKKVWEMASAAPDEYSFGVFYRNVYLARMNQLPQRLLEFHQYPEGGMSVRIEQGMDYMWAFAGIDQLLEVGDISQATGCALLCQTIMGNRSSHMLRRLSELAMISGNYSVAGKYLDILSGSLVHRKWAQAMMDSISTGQLTAELRYYRSITSPQDRLYLQNDSYGAARSILDGNPGNRIALDYMLCSYLLGKNVNSFCSAYDRYYRNLYERFGNVPALYQQALMVNVSSRESYEETVARYRIDPAVAQMYLDFLDARQSSGNGLAGLEKFRGTYWYYLVSTKLASK